MKGFPKPCMSGAGTFMFWQDDEVAKSAGGARSCTGYTRPFTNPTRGAVENGV